MEPNVVPVPVLVDRIPEDQPLVLRPRLSRFVAVFGTAYIGIPVVLYGGVTLFLLATDGLVSWDTAAILLLPGAMSVVFGLLQLALMAFFGMSGGPYLAAGPAGVWVRARKWPVKAVYLPWPLVARVYPRRWLWDRMICVLAHDTRAGANAGAWARVDMGVQRALFGSRLTASTYYCGRRADDVLTHLYHLSAGRVPIG